MKHMQPSQVIMPPANLHLPEELKDQAASYPWDSASHELTYFNLQDGGGVALHFKDLKAARYERGTPGRVVLEYPGRKIEIVGILAKKFLDRFRARTATNLRCRGDDISSIVEVVENKERVGRALERNEAVKKARGDIESCGKGDLIARIKREDKEEKARLAAMT